MSNPPARAAVTRPPLAVQGSRPEQLFAVPALMLGCALAASRPEVVAMLRAKAVAAQAVAWSAWPTAVPSAPGVWRR